MESYKITPERFAMKRFLFLWFLVNFISIGFMVILSGTVQYYFDAFIPIGFGMYVDTQLFFMSWGIAIFGMANLIFYYYYLKKKKPINRRRR